MRGDKAVGFGCLNGDIFFQCLPVKERVSIFPDVERCVKKVSDELVAHLAGSIFGRKSVVDEVSFMCLKPELRYSASEKITPAYFGL